MKSTKLILLGIVVILLSSFTIKSKHEVVALYLSYEDYKTSKLNYVNASKIQLNTFFETPYISVTESNSKLKLLKKNVYGFKDASAKTYRLYQNKVFEIIDTAGFFLYKNFTTKNLTNGKGFIKEDAYYFSQTGSSEIVALNISSLEKAFSSNTKFRYALESAFKTDKELTAYDNYNAQYKIKYLYSQSLQ
ncbi:MAG: hypothetical protein C0459_10875 [Chitinophaga sp.]|jgi:hypothetical protein|nr:hypothetical protein [Chitinophaga sp.]